MTIKIPLKKVYVVVVLLLFFYTSDSIYTYVFNQFDHAIEIITDILMLLPVWRLEKNRVIKIAGFNILISFLILVTASINFRNTEYLYLFALVVRMAAVSVFISWCFAERIDVLGIACNIIYIMAIFYLVCYLVFDSGILGIEPQMVRVAGYNGSERKYSTYGCFWGFYYRWDFSRKMLGRRVVACNGFFREVGVYQIFLNFAALWYMFIDEKKSKRIFVLTLAVVSTFSGMGWLILATLYGIKVLRKTKLGITLGVIFVIGLVIGMFFVLNEKLTHYVGGRQRNLSLALELIAKGKISGNGYGRNFVSWYGLLNYFINFGIVGLLPVIIFIEGIFKGTFGIKLKSKIAFVIWWGFSLMNEAAGYCMFFLAIYTVCFIRLCDGLSYVDTIFNRIDWENTKICKISIGKVQSG